MTKLDVMTLHLVDRFAFLTGLARFAGPWGGRESRVSPLVIEPGGGA